MGGFWGSGDALILNRPLPLCNLSRLICVILDEGIIAVNGTAEESKELSQQGVSNHVTVNSSQNDMSHTHPSSSINTTICEDGERDHEKEDTPDTRVHKFLEFFFVLHSLKHVVVDCCRAKRSESEDEKRLLFFAQSQHSRHAGMQQQAVP